MVSHTCVGNGVKKGDGEDTPEWGLDWLLYLSRVLCMRSRCMFMLLLEGLHSWTACRVQEAERLQLNPSENKRTAYLLRERQLGIPLPSAARVMRAQGSCKRTKL